MTNDTTTSPLPDAPATDNAPEKDELSGPGVRPAVVLQTFLNFFDEPRYLEVGVAGGGTFHQVEAAYKVAVDPRFRFDWEAEQRDRGPATQYHQVTSDTYFGSIVDADQEFDVIYLDGLHTFEQTLRDLNNAVDHLSKGGVILIDDVRPSSYQASLPDIEDFRRVRLHLKDERRAWMGDVYKLVWCIDTFYQNLSYACISNNHGQAVVWRERRESVNDRKAAEIAELSFSSFVRSKDVLKLRPFGEILNSMREYIGRR